MSFVSSLLQAIVRLDGEAVVLHVGENPYIVTPTEQVDLATKALTFDAATGILNQLLPPDPQNALEEFGAVQYQMPGMPELPGEHFTVVAATGGDDIWIEIRRRQVPDEDRVPLEVFAAPPGAEVDKAVPARPAAVAGPDNAGVGSPPPLPEVERIRLIADAAAAKPAREIPGTTPRPATPMVPITASESAPVLPLTRSPIRPALPARLPEGTSPDLERVLRLAAARGASMLYLSSRARPSIRVDGDIEILEGTPVLSANDVEALLLTLMPERGAEALRSGAATEWIFDHADLGHVRCMTFRDTHGPGGVFRLMRPRGVSAEQLALPREIQALALEPDGLVLIAGPRSSGKRTLMSALVDLVNRKRRGHVITIESEITVTHDRVGALISQREIRGGPEEMLGAARAALREDPDMLLLENVRTPELMQLALDAAASGHLVIGGLAAPSAGGAIDRIIDLYPAEQRRPVQVSLAQSLRGVVAQVLLKKNGGGRVAARELLLNTPAVRSVLAEGKTSQLPAAIEGGRALGMTPLNDSLLGLVQSGLVDVRETYRHAADRPGFVALLKRQGLDASALEKYA